MIWDSKVSKVLMQSDAKKETQAFVFGNTLDNKIILINTV